MKVKNGDKVKDTVSGFTGIVIGLTDFLNGCTRCGVQAPVGKDGKLPETMWFDEPQLKIIKIGAVKSGETKKKTGGVMISTPTRNISG